MRTINRNSLINKIRQAARDPQEFTPAYWMLEDGKYYKYIKGDWQPVESINPGRNDHVFTSMDEVLPPLSCHVYLNPGRERTRQYLIKCNCSPEEIEMRLSELRPVRKHTELIIKLFEPDMKIK